MEFCTQCAYSYTLCWHLGLRETLNLKKTKTVIKFIWRFCNTLLAFELQRKNIFEANKNSNKNLSGYSIKPQTNSENMSKTHMKFQKDGNKTCYGGKNTRSKHFAGIWACKFTKSKYKRVTIL